MEIEQLEKQALTEIENCPDSRQLEELRIKYLGKKGLVAEGMKTLPAMAAGDRKTFGENLNRIKASIAESLNTKLQSTNYNLPTTVLDITLPGTKWPTGHPHPVTQTITEIENIFQRLGYTRSRYGEVETDYYNFEALNIPRDHPARDEQETYYVAPDTVLTTHTSNGQVREMEKGILPIRMLNISKCYRRQSDITHTPMFHQFEGLLIDQTASITDLKGTIDYFVKSYFGPKMQSRIRPYNFRFTEPSFEVDVTCTVCKGQGCTTCKDGWVELGGAGMVHPNVLRNGKVSHDRYSGFAFGWGLERCFIMKYNIRDIRLLYSTDLRILQQF